MKKILVIEDEARTRNIFLECLELEGFNAIGAENGWIGVQMVHEVLPDLVLCDVKMPELDGYGVLNTLRQNPSSATIPFIFLTAQGTKAELRQGMELRADDYLTKPFTVEELLRAIAACLEKQAAPRQCGTADTAKPTVPQSIFPACSQLSEVFHFIEANYYQPIGISDVAQAVGYSPAYLTDLVRRQTGQPLHQWIVKRRMAKACSLLLETNQTVAEIAEAVGYNYAGCFFRQFRISFGMTPHAWRNAQRI